MANRLINPNLQFSDSTGLPYAGGSLSFYASGTSTPLNTYSNQALTVANTNPVVLDSAGRAGNVFLSNLAYKLVLADANGVQIFTADPVYSSDFSTVAQFSTYPGDPSGHVAGTQGTGSIPASVVYDTTNNVLYVAITTGTAATTVWFPINTTAQSVIAAPGGYLTPVQGTPVLTSDTGNPYSQIFYSPYLSNVVPIFNGTSFTSLTFTTSTSLTLSSLHSANSIYDVFIFNNSGVATLCTGPAWVDLTANGVTPPRGSGPATTQITNLNGIWVNNSPLLTPVNGALTLSPIAPFYATYVGSFYTDNTAGQTTVNVTYGQSRKRGIYNAYNRLPVMLKAGDPKFTPTTWNPTNAWRSSDNLPPTYTLAIMNVGSGTLCNSINILDGLGEENLDLRFTQIMTLPAASGGNSSGMLIGIGVNLATGASAPSPIGLTACGQSTGAGGTIQTPVALYQTTPILGLATVTSLEKSIATAGGDPVLTGTEANMVLEAHYRA